MHTGALKKWALALTFWLALHLSSLRAQVLGPYTNSSASFEVDANGVLYETGTGATTLSLSGAGTRMFWYPGESAFRAGTVTGTDWDSANIGYNSLATGYNNKASGSESAAFGGLNVSSGGCSITAGNLNTASGEFSGAFGFYNTASGMTAMSFGWQTRASAMGATSFGQFTTASGGYATTFGEGTVASSYDSTASGWYTTASGYAATASGLYTTASAYASFVIGRCNIGGGTPGSWVATDPLFEVGNGTDSSHLSDALLVDKSGNVTAKTFITTAASGDIPMYTGNP